ncbi:hypothetical protein [Paracraurococcus lichenis]|uniref:Anti-sigma factor NepR domain-containing protein n=1 Tax=Paracraurococcus lichenis TaxID=3064888 RepID=A0ABT9E7Q5_9PROT|nr:hypothetical protein [Paracraurococcus sp. LOR1-02]MDO9712210.1 hypothetical protein [Paracraurococcus sp. LOR1-02]
MEDREEDPQNGAGGASQNQMSSGEADPTADNTLMSWISHGLHEALDAVIDETLPSEFLRILDEHAESPDTFPETD